jgi:prepilin-type N-terminal cleavage/methylation domain-containing protein
MKHTNPQTGFSLVELLVAMAITLIVLAGTLAAFSDAVRANEAAMQMAEMQQNLRAGMNLMVRDFSLAGQGLPTGGIPVPNGPGALPITRPSPPGFNYTFPAGTAVLPGVSPGAGMGPALLGQVTDMVTILSADNTLPLNQSPLTAIAPNGSSMTVDPGTPISGIANPIQPGDLAANRPGSNSKDRRQQSSPPGPQSWSPPGWRSPQGW